tara:strand:+ start:622 stop:1209 length:588 start_codon:yes stop_codon:yes gene_type:complete
MILMQPIDVYQMYCAMKAHFSKSSYNFIKYGGKTKVSRDSFWKRNDRYFFVKISKKYNNDEIKDYLLSNFIQNRNGYIANFNDQNYENWLDRKMMFYNIFQQELKPYIKNFEPLFEVKDGNHPTLLKEYLGKRVSLETMVILDELVDFSKKWDKQLGDDVVWPDIKNLMNNYKGFLTINKNKYRMKLLSLIEESS